MRLKDMKLTRQEQAIEDAFLRGEYVSVSKAEFNRTARKTGGVLNSTGYRKQEALQIVPPS